MARIAVTLSGGGYRASLFGLGVLLYLADAAKNREVTSISSVSGGSITNGFVAQLGRYHSRRTDDLWSQARFLAGTIAEETLWSTRRSRAYLLLMVLSLPAIAYACFWLSPWAWWAKVLSFLALFLLWGWLAQMRGVVAGRAFGEKLYSPRGSLTRLEQIEKEIDHVLCATHMNAGEHFYFSGRFVYSYRFGWGIPGGLPFHSAVQASAAFPGGFPPRWFRTRQFELEGGAGCPEKVPYFVTLTDGGVYDNMADQWPGRVEGRAIDRPELGLQVPDELIVVNASAGLKCSTVRNLHVPLYGEIAALLRNVRIMYDNSASLRMSGLVDQFEAASSLRGALVTIEQSPLKIPGKYAHGDSSRADRARAVLDKLGGAEDWKGIVEENAKVRTRLSRLGATVSAQLIRHGYATAMANLHVLLDYPLLDLPEPRKFEELATRPN